MKNPEEYSRRDLLKSIAATGLTATVVAYPATADAANPDERSADEKADRQRVLALGFTETEADCWEHLAKAAGKFFALEELHPSDAREMAQAIHVVQNKLLSRPTYRKYLELAKPKINFTPPK